MPLNSSHGFSGNFFDLFSAYTVVAGIAVVALFAVHGATYLTLRTAGDFRERAASMARELSIPAAVQYAALAPPPGAATSTSGMRPRGAQARR